MLAVFAVPVAAAADLTTQTEDWTFTAPDVLGTQADLELNARQVQLCTDEMERLIAYRPLRGQRFAMHWVIDGGRFSEADGSTVINHVPDAAWRLVDPSARAFRESIVAQRLCFGPHEITHVLTAESLWPLSWANEGFATFTDWLFRANWRCCTTTPPLTGVACDDAGWSDGGVGRRPYADLSPWDGSYASYATAACLWLEVHRVGGADAIRRILARLRADAPFTNGQFFAHHVNHVLGRDIDQRMGERTRNRPVASGRVTPAQALEFGLVLSALSFALLASAVNVLTATLALVGNLFYVVVYTRWLKRSTPQNIVIGGAAGAVPPLVGYAAATGDLGLPALWLFLIVFLWTPPHFWALALMIKKAYAAAGVPMLPVVRGDRETARQILLYSIGLVAFTLAVGLWLGPVYTVAAAVLGAILLVLAVLLRRDLSTARAQVLFHYSLAYLALLFVAAAIDPLLT